ncbi:UNVERIFIED_ORG: hypothetical protein M2193_004603 [Bradyrhizobium japonicum]
MSDLHCYVAPTKSARLRPENPAFDPMLVVEVGT